MDDWTGADSAEEAKEILGLGEIGNLSAEVTVGRRDVHTVASHMAGWANILDLIFTYVEDERREESVLFIQVEGDTTNLQRFLDLLNAGTRKEGFE